MKNKIGWCSMTWNPCWGCLNNCEYCYARAIAKRFWKQRYMEEVSYHFKIHPGWVWTGDQYTGLKDFKPTFLEAQFDKKFPKKPQRIFVGSMSEIYYWKEEWVEMVIEKVKQYPQHTFIFLTKHQEFYSKWIWPNNCWLGLTITKETDWNKSKKMWTYFFSKNNQAWITGKRLLTFLSFEPLLGYVSTEWLKISNIDWVIIGAETGNRKNKVKPKRSWIENILYFCRRNKIPAYIKDNLSKYYDEYRGYKQFPEKRGG